ncbi:S8 family serine peptidase [Halobacillus litoralis]|uniref:S8 family serine peptidase n=1 Tax=Halobacillus litoralis TaxID=45668 RepID=A0A845F9N6_9BACI|nr:S8 family serine peptidase [Halobacillus litoralis]MYL70571.1 S8 family serine peptidase [Halobacillus litoralis]
MKKKHKYLIPVIAVVLATVVLILYNYYQQMNDLEKLQWTNTQISTWGRDLMEGDVIQNNQNKIKVAILDSGINDEHPDLVGKVKGKYNAFNGSDQTKDDLNHGTAVAGIITANDNNNGVIGVNQNIQLYDVKILGKNGHGNLEHLSKGIQWAIKQEVDLINLSFGFQSDSSELKQIINEAVSSGIIVVAAAGNTFNLGMDYPAQYNNVVSVNAIDSNKDLINAAALGKTDFVAPGEDILSTDSAGGYSLFSGTSFASAYITGGLSYWMGEFKDSPGYEPGDYRGLLNYVQNNDGLVTFSDRNKQQYIKIK